ncbi:MAG: tRNA 2-thiouridine(34) synthase MnmA [Pseudomonadota bacterium]|jgi:tRNA-specific 2-thiouridylase
MAYVVIGMSGGVDSSVAAWLLKQQGHTVHGVFMKNWEDDDDSEYCSSRQDWLDAASVADKIGIDIDAVNFSSNYKQNVFSHFLSEYEAGRTPNPDIFCNSEIKFKAFLEYAMNLGADYIATGHYAKLEADEKNNIVNLKKAVDNTKDQSYFLYRLQQHQLQKSLFPLGDIPKTQVREIAKNLNLHNATKKDSTGICFIGERPFREFLNKYVANKHGKILTDTGKVIGEHIGLAFYTIGQRKGIGIGGLQNSSGEPWFVARKDVENNMLYVVQGHDHPWLLQNIVTTQDMSFTSDFAQASILNNIGNNTDLIWNGSAKTRYRQVDASCILQSKKNITNNQLNSLELSFSFEQAQWAVTAGQSLVLYKDEVCLGGGIIYS